jgi:transcriptional regulator with XRE-family HTH domain
MKSEFQTGAIIILLPNNQLRGAAIDKIVGTNITRAMSESQLKGADLARALHVNLATFRQMETGDVRVSAEQLFILCRYFGMRPGFFYKGLNLREGELFS